MESRKPPILQRWMILLTAIGIGLAYSPPHGIPLDRVITAIRGSNLDVGAKTVETGGMEFIVRGMGFLGSGGDTKTRYTYGGKKHSSSF